MSEKKITGRLFVRYEDTSEARPHDGSEVESYHWLHFFLYTGNEAAFAKYKMPEDGKIPLVTEEQVDIVLQYGPHDLVEMRKHIGSLRVPGSEEETNPDLSDVWSYFTEQVGTRTRSEDAKKTDDEAVIRKQICDDFRMALFKVYPSKSLVSLDPEFLQKPLGLPLPISMNDEPCKQIGTFGKVLEEVVQKCPTHPHVVDLLGNDFRTHYLVFANKQNENAK